ncbi:MAG TPA: protein phosphatase 2C domain-containing protein [Candidatus Binataceae bacterium]|nr:protein phosphatase 2C domain-containing protein [Candidatus Binataceae bacterium]
MGREETALNPQAGAAHFELAALTDIGTDRPNNEDACGVWQAGPDECLMVVADGVGGYEGGEIASQMAVEISIAAYRDGDPQVAVAKRLLRAVQRANIEIYNRRLTVPELGRMATTVTAAVLCEGMLYAAHVGDCRLYLVRAGKIRQLTKDHTMIGERVRLGLMSAQEARMHPERNALSRCLGHELIVSIDRLTIPLVRGDQVLLCSDGVHGTLAERDLMQLIHDQPPLMACRRLIEEANLRGAADNVTAAVMAVHQGCSSPAPAGFWARVRGLWERRG